jgi:phospholipid/cholesterol/gamma-HCH transport system substrate-binding protein
LGAFVIGGTFFLVVALYFIGNKQNIFGSTFRISATFNNVNGLMKGNNVRFAGIDVGTVERVEIINDSAVNVVMLIEDNARQFMRKNVVASVGTDGLMGNKLVNISSVKEPAPGIAEGDVIRTLKPIETDEMVRTLNRTNEDVAVITSNLRTITEKVKSPNTLWSLLMDTLVAKNVKQAVVNIKVMSANTVMLTGDLNAIVKEVRSGKGMLGTLITDQTMPDQMKHTLVKIESISDSMARVTGDLKYISGLIRSGNGLAGTLLMDTSLVHDLSKSMQNLQEGSGRFSENMEAVKRSWPFRKYYRRQEKLKGKGKI